MAETIIRDPTRSELRDFVPLQTPSGKVKSPQDRFSESIAVEQQKAMKKGLPFAEAAVRAEAKDMATEAEKKWKRQGYVDKDWNPKIDWNRYSDLKNFEEVDKGHVHDRYLSNVHRLPVFINYVRYKFKGFSNTYTVMEGEETAVQRARDAVENRKPIEKPTKDK